MTLGWTPSSRTSSLLILNSTNCFNSWGTIINHRGMEMDRWVDETVYAYEPATATKIKFEEMRDPIPLVYIPQKPNPNGLLDYKISWRRCTKRACEDNEQQSCVDQENFENFGELWNHQGKNRSTSPWLLQSTFQLCWSSRATLFELTLSMRMCPHYQRKRGLIENICCADLLATALRAFLIQWLWSEIKTGCVGLQGCGNAIETPLSSCTTPVRSFTPNWLADKVTLFFHKHPARNVM